MRAPARNLQHLTRAHDHVPSVEGESERAGQQARQLLRFMGMTGHDAAAPKLEARHGHAVGGDKLALDAGGDRLGRNVAPAVMNHGCRRGHSPTPRAYPRPGAFILSRTIKAEDAEGLRTQMKIDMFNHVFPRKFFDRY